jgi:Lipoprotein LpqB beta-propeller domain
MRSVRPALIVALLVTLVAAGCGIPDDSAVVPVGPGPSRGTSLGDDLGPPKKLRTDTIDKSAFLTNFLSAAAGDYDSATDEVKKFMSPDAAATFKPTASTDIRVVHLEERPLINPDDPNATLQVRQVGTLNEAGVLRPSGSLETGTKYTITIGTVDGQAGLFVTKMSQPALLLSDTALAEFYTPRTIYFWNNDKTGLVPDVRYMPTSVPKEQQPTVILSWLIGGPPEWLQPAVVALPTGTKPLGVVPAVTKGTMQINLSSQALPPDYTSKDPGALTRLQEQLRWSLRLNLPPAMELNVQGVEPQTYHGDDYLDSNALHRRPPDPERFVVYDGQIRRLGRAPNSSEALPVVGAAANRGVQMAAFGASRSLMYAALVAKDTGGNPVLRVGSAAPGKQAATLRQIPLRGSVGRPVWAVSPPVGTADGTFGLITANGRLYSFPPDGRTISPVGGVTNVSAVAVAPDARRVAVISSGRLYLAVLSDEDGLQLSTPTLIRTQMINLTGVDWSDEGTLVVSGLRPDNDNRVAIMDVSIDGAVQNLRLPDLGSRTLSHLTAYPADPAGNGSTEVPVAYESNGAAYDESSSEKKIGVGELAPPVTNPRAALQLTAPFFLS